MIKKITALSSSQLAICRATYISGQCELFYLRSAQSKLGSLRGVARKNRRDSNVAWRNLPKKGTSVDLRSNNKHRHPSSNWTVDACEKQWASIDMVSKRGAKKWVQKLLFGVSRVPSLFPKRQCAHKPRLTVRQLSAAALEYFHLWFVNSECA